MIQTETSDSALLLVGVLVTCSGCINNIINYNINNEKLLNSNNNRSKNKAPLGYRRFQIGYVFTEYDLLNTMNLIQNHSAYTPFHIFFKVTLCMFFEALNTFVKIFK